MISPPGNGAAAPPAAVQIVLSVYSVVVFTVLWVGFIAAVLVDPGVPEQLWNRVGELPRWAQILIWILALPIMVGLYVWRASWPLAVRLAGLAAIAAWTAVAIVGVVRVIRRSS